MAENDTASADKLTSEPSSLEWEAEEALLKRVLLRRQVSLEGRLLEWLKALTVPAALVGVFASFLVGASTFRETQQRNATERLNHLADLLANETPNVRVRGVTSFKHILFERNHSWILTGSGQLSNKTQVLQFLIDRLAVEDDPRVQGVILQTLQRVKDGHVDVKGLSEALATAAELNRATMLEVVTAWTAESKAVGATADRTSAGSAKQFETVTIMGETVALRPGLFQGDRSDERVRLGNLGRVMIWLLEAGARTRNLSRIYCEGCSFDNVPSLEGVDLSESILAGAAFSNVDLSNAVLADADLGGAAFHGATLRGAKLTNTGVGPPERPGSKYDSVLDTRWRRALADYRSERVSFRSIPSGAFPDLRCAKLAGADLSGLPIVAITITKQPGTNGYSLSLVGGWPGELGDGPTPQISKVGVVEIRRVALPKDPSAVAEGLDYSVLDAFRADVDEYTSDILYGAGSLGFSSVAATSRGRSTSVSTSQVRVYSKSPSQVRVDSSADVQELNLPARALLARYFDKAGWRQSLFPANARPALYRLFSEPEVGLLSRPGDCKTTQHREGGLPQGLYMTMKAQDLFGPAG